MTRYAIRLKRRSFLGGVVTSSGFALSACSTQMRLPLNASEDRDLAKRNVTVIRVTEENISQYTDSSWLQLNGVRSNPPADPGAYTYRVGPGDQLRILTWTTPERRIAQDNDIVSEGPVVDETGQFFFPFVGNMRASGRTVAQIRQDLETALRAYIADPQVEVAVQSFNAHRVSITGSINEPGSRTVTNIPLRLMDLVNQAGETSDSDLRQVVIRRRGQEYRVNLRAFMEAGLRGHNPILLPGDMVFVPPISDNRVFTFGEIQVGEIRLGRARKTLTEVLAVRGGPSRTRGDARGIFVFRRDPAQAEGFLVFQFDLRNAATLMLTSQFAMAPMDVVFVTTDPITRWNDTIGRLLSPVRGVVRAADLGQDIADLLE